MKAVTKTFIVAILCLMALSANAQRCAVLEFKAGVGISQNDVDGISAIFITYFSPAGYTMVERTQIDKVIEEQGFQRSKMTQAQMVRLGEILNVSKIVVGDINIVMGQYNVDARVINVETGTISATEGATFTSTSYRASMQNLAQKLAAKIDITPNRPIRPQTASQGYTDLGLPSGTIWKNHNAMGFYTYDEAIRQFGNRLPSNEQWEELRAECIWEWIGNGYKVTGPNGNSILLPITSYQYCDDFNIWEEKNIDYDLVVKIIKTTGAYWSSTSDEATSSCLIFIPDFQQPTMTSQSKCNHYSVRAIQN